MGTTVVYKDDNGASHVLRFDGVMSEKATDTSTLTSYPIEKGSPVTDHVRDENDTVSLSVMMTNTPMHGESYVTGEKIGAVNTIKLSVPKFDPPFIPTPGAISGAVTGAIKGAINSVIGNSETPEQATVLMFVKPFNFVSEMLVKLKEVKKKRFFCTVVTAMFDYENMLLIGISPDRSTSSNSATFDLQFQRVNVVTTKKTAAPVPAEPRGKKKKNAGVKDATPATHSDEDRKSFLKAASGAAGKFLKGAALGGGS